MAGKRQRRSVPVTSGYETFRQFVVTIALVVGVFYALVHSVIFSLYILSFKGGIAAAKVMLAVTGGVTGGLSIWAMVLFFSVTFAPESWLQSSATGLAWMRRSGLKSKSTIGLRIMSLILSLAATTWAVVCILSLMTALLSSK